MTALADEADGQVGSKSAKAGTELHSPPRVSIGMPVFNGMAFIERAVNCLLAQTFGDFEFIILDNSSTDGTYEFARTLTKDPRVRVEQNDRNIGAIANFVKVLSLARGEYFMWAAADDAWEPEYVARLVAELDKHPASGVAMSATRRVHQAGDTRDIVRFLGPENPEALGPLRLALEMGSPRKWSFFIYGLFRRQLLQQAVRYFPEGGAPERILLAQLALHSPFRYVDEILYRRQLHEATHEKRYPDEAYSRIVAMGIRGDLHFLWSLFVSLLASPVVPLHRKFYIPLIVARFALTRVSRFLPKRPLERLLAARDKVLWRSSKLTRSSWKLTQRSWQLIRSWKLTQRSWKLTQRILKEGTRRLRRLKKTTKTIGRRLRPRRSIALFKTRRQNK